MAKDFEELTPDEQHDAFLKFLSDRKARKVKSKSKSKARTSVLNKYKTEFDTMVMEIAGGIDLPTFTKEDEKKIIQQHKEKKVKAKAKSQARSAIIKKHQPEYDAALAEAAAKE